MAIYLSFKLNSNPSILVSLILLDTYHSGWVDTIENKFLFLLNHLRPSGAKEITNLRYNFPNWQSLVSFLSATGFGMIIGAAVSKWRDSEFSGSDYHQTAPHTVCDRLISSGNKGWTFNSGYQFQDNFVGYNAKIKRDQNILAQISSRTSFCSLQWQWQITC